MESRSGWREGGDKSPLGAIAVDPRDSSSHIAPELGEAAVRGLRHRASELGLPSLYDTAPHLNQRLVVHLGSLTHMKVEHLLSPIAS